jgi:hypothetical protein
MRRKERSRAVPSGESHLNGLRGVLTTLDGQVQRLQDETTKQKAELLREKERTKKLEAEAERYNRTTADLERRLKQK